MANPPTADNAKKIGRGGRKRRVAGWTLLLLGLLVAGVWVQIARSAVFALSDTLGQLVTRGKGPQGSQTYYVTLDQRSNLPTLRDSFMIADGATTFRLCRVGRTERPLGAVSSFSILVEQWNGLDFSPVSGARAGHVASAVWTDQLSLAAAADGQRKRVADFRMTYLYPLCVIGVLTAAAWAVQRLRPFGRTKHGVCRACGYSLAGLAAGATCPECGKAPATGAVSTPPSGD